VTTILLARHGETDWNLERRFQGWADPPLNETGRAQARALAEQLRDTPFDAVYSSDLKRAHETAEILAVSHGVPVVADQGLREIDVGPLQGLTWTEVHERWGDDRPHGETREQHHARVRGAVERIARDHAGQRILIVTHGGTMRALHSIARDGADVEPVQNCGVIELHFRDDRLAVPIE
jgi:2,3-bisphosphoglycerate-dependent phosphoglycerate mutase